DNTRPRSGLPANSRPAVGRGGSAAVRFAFSLPVPIRGTGWMSAGGRRPTPMGASSVRDAALERRHSPWEQRQPPRLPRQGVRPVGDGALYSALPAMKTPSHGYVSSLRL